ncbi:glycoside hydrolase [Pedobacter cryoconitis]|uniref:Glycosyl hydrolase family 101 n=1 Tax=Pedobacter cryoconitis TaxID=188932 RepID=A0A7X0MJX5_9SPHI|nr:glycoside hydrolase [Pedobacter cryoconitis]MBB6501962.1 hypothetical protein [Pedobacter cryoconitis]
MKLLKYFLLFILFLAFSLGKAQNKQLIRLSDGKLKVDVNPETFSLTAIDEKGKIYVISAPGPKLKVSGLKQDATQLSWDFSNGLTVLLGLHHGYLDVNIKASDTTHLIWPRVETAFKALTIPLYQGKYIPAQDEKWQAHFAKNSTISGSQDLSMQFFATNFEDKALVYVIRNMFNNELEFYTHAGRLALQFKHEFPLTVKDKQYGFRVYLVHNDPVSIAKTYKTYVTENNPVITLEEKARDNANIRKLYGAPHIYIWNNEFIVAEDIRNWKQLKLKIIHDLAAVPMNPTKWIFKLFGENGAEAGQEFLAALDEFKKDEYISKYQKGLLSRALNEALKRKDFYNVASWKDIELDSTTRSLLSKGQRNPMELYQLNKALLYNAYDGLLKPVKDWGGAPTTMIDEMQQAGIKHAWLGLNDWVAGEIHPEFVKKAEEGGYLIGPYDSYHSMHQPGHEKWLTAKFEDTSLYDNAFVLKKNGRPATGFLGQGRKLNPVLSLLAVQQRMEGLMKDTAHEFNSWFIDCDGTGEILDDYTPGRMTDQQQDLEARLKRMTWIRDQYQLVIGTEVGNDFAANTIAFGHGMTTPVIAWDDEDMRKNKASEYFIGAYYANDGGIPGRYGLQAPLKEEYQYIYFDNRFNLPLYQLVYNDAVITSHHWEWGSLKVPGEIKNTALKEILYNVPPLYHLDQVAWTKYREIISKQVKIFAQTHEMAVKLEMTGFGWLTNDRLVQQTTFGKMLEVTANFNNSPFIFKGQTIPAHSLLIHNLLTDKYEGYQP